MTDTELIQEMDAVAAASGSPLYLEGKTYNVTNLTLTASKITGSG